METNWGATNLNNKPEEYSSSTEREARSIALEKAYVHDVYSQIASHFSDSRYRAWPKVKQFLLELEPGSIVCDVGCGNGKYLDINPSIYKIGIDRCSNLTGAAREKNHEVLISDNLNIPFRDDCFDAVISIAVIHHFATTERRVAALKELARVLRIGGRLMVSVWAMEQRHRRFESQDVLVPWSRPMHSSSDDKTSSIERDLNSTTTTTSDDDAATHYHAYTQTSDSDHSYPSCSIGGRKRGRSRHRGRSIDPTCSSSQSSSDLSSPNESCYTFVRKALQKLAGTRRRRPWFLQGLDIPLDEDGHHFGSLEEDVVDGLELGNHFGNQQINNFMPIELHQLESMDYAELFQQGQGAKFDGGKPPKPKPGMLFSNVLYPRRRTLETTSELQPSGSSGPIPNTIAGQPKSKSLSDLFGLIPVGILRSQRKSAEDLETSRNAAAAELQLKLLAEAAGTRSTSSLLSGAYSLPQQPPPHYDFPEGVSHKAVQTDSRMSSCESLGESRPSFSDLQQSDVSDGVGGTNKLRPVLVKQKQSISSPSASAGSGEEGTFEETYNYGPTTTMPKEEMSSSSLCWGELKKSVRDLPELRRRPSTTTSNTLQVPQATGTTRGGLGLESSFWKQSSLNEELIFSERLKEKQLLKQQVQKQCSLNEELIYKQRRENTRWDAMKEAILNSPNVKCLQLIKNGISSRFRGGSSGDVGGNSNGNSPQQPTFGSNGDRNSGVEHSSSSNSEGHSPSPTATSHNQNNYHQRTSPPSGPPPSASASIRNGIVRMLQNWKQGEVVESSANPPQSGGSTFGVRRGPSKDSSQGQPRSTGRGLFPPFFLRRSSAGSLTLSKDHPMSPSKVLSPPHHLKRRPSENELLHNDGLGGPSNGNKLLPGVRHIRKLSREEGSDSSKDSSFQSDTSVDSEDSFASVIFIPNNKSGGLDGTAGPDSCFTFNTETRANSTDSDRSPKSPASRLSPPNHSNLPKSPSPLASELLNRRRSPEVSPTKLGGHYTTGASRESPKFVFDEHATTKLLSPAPIGGHHSPGTEMASSETEQPPNGIQTDDAIVVVRIPQVVQEQTPQHCHKLLLDSPPSVCGHVTKKKVEKIEVLRKPGILPEGNTMTRQFVRRSLPKSLAVELYNPETEDADTSESSSSSTPNSVSSVVSVVNEDMEPSLSQLPSDDTVQVATTSTISQLDDFQPTELSSILEEPIVVIKTEPPPLVMPEEEDVSHPPPPKSISPPRKSSSSNVLETAANIVSSLEGLVSSSSSLTSPTGNRRKLTLAKLGSTSEWLISLPYDLGVSRTGCGAAGGSSASSSTSSSGPPPLIKRSSLERRHAAGGGGEKLLLGDVKKYQTKGPDAKWPSSIMDDSPPPSAAFSTKPEEVSMSYLHSSSSVPLPDSTNNTIISTAELNAKLLEEMEEGDSLFDSIENLSTSRQHPSRNPSIDSSVRMSSTCSCSIRGGESFESWSSAKSSLTNSSSTHQTSMQPPVPLQSQNKASNPTVLPLSQPRPTNNNNNNHHNNHHHHHSHKGCSGGGISGGGTSSSSRIRQQGNSSKSSSGVGDENENSTPLTYHRYYHVFREGELDKLIEKYVQNLHIISSYYDHANWCIIAERVEMWTI